MKKFRCNCGAETEHGTVYDEETNKFHIDSCCGGGCWAVPEAKYCPYCGELYEKSL